MYISDDDKFSWLEWRVVQQWAAKLDCYFFFFWISKLLLIMTSHLIWSQTSSVFACKWCSTSRSKKRLCVHVLKCMKINFEIYDADKIYMDKDEKTCKGTRTVKVFRLLCRGGSSPCFFFFTETFSRRRQWCNCRNRTVNDKESYARMNRKKRKWHCLTQFVCVFFLYRPTFDIFQLIFSLVLVVFHLLLCNDSAQAIGTVAYRQHQT